MAHLHVCVCIWQNIQHHVTQHTPQHCGIPSSGRMHFRGQRELKPQAKAAHKQKTATKLLPDTAHTQQPYEASAGRMNEKSEAQVSQSQLELHYLTL